MICKNCGNEISYDAKQCMYCGFNQTQTNYSVENHKDSQQYAPVLQLQTGGSLTKMFFLGLLTCGIYTMVIYSRISGEINIVASRYDGKRTIPFFGMGILTPFTCFIYTFVWYHTFSDRVGRELVRRGYNYKFGASDYWLWNILGSLIIIGPLVYIHKLMKAMNMINASYNIYG